MRSFRLSPDTQKQITLIAADLKINQTEALEVAVQDFFLRLRSEEPPEGAEDTMEERVFGPDEALARQYERVADLYESDDTLKESFRGEVSRLMRGTAESLRRGGA